MRMEFLWFDNKEDRFVLKSGVIQIFEDLNIRNKLFDTKDE